MGVASSCSSAPDTYISLNYELTSSFLFEFENDGMEPSKRYSFVSLIFILKVAYYSFKRVQEVYTINVQT